MKTTSQAQILTGIYSEVQQHFANINDPAHGWEHVRCVYSLALQITDAEGADGFIVSSAVLLRDIGRMIHE